MMGYKTRRFGPIGNLTLEELVPEDHFYRHLEQSLDLTFVRDLVRTRYAALGRPSIDPVVFFKLGVKLDGHHYFVSRTLVGQRVTLRIDGASRMVVIEHDGKEVKRVALQGTGQPRCTFEQFVAQLCEEARIGRRRAAPLPQRAPRSSEATPPDQQGGEAEEKNA